MNDTFEIVDPVFQGIDPKLFRVFSLSFILVGVVTTVALVFYTSFSLFFVFLMVFVGTLFLAIYLFLKNFCYKILVDSDNGKVFAYKIFDKEPSQYDLIQVQYSKKLKTGKLALNSRVLCHMKCLNARFVIGTNSPDLVDEIFSGHVVKS